MKTIFAVFLTIFSFSSKAGGTPWFVTEGNARMERAGFGTKTNISNGEWAYTIFDNTIHIPDDSGTGETASLNLSSYMHEKGHAWLLINRDTAHLPIATAISSCDKRIFRGRIDDGITEGLPDIIAFVANGEREDDSLLAYRRTPEGRERRPKAESLFFSAVRWLKSHRGGDAHTRVGRSLAYACSTLPEDIRHRDEIISTARRNAETFFGNSRGTATRKDELSFGHGIPSAFNIAYGSCLAGDRYDSLLEKSNACGLAPKERKEAFCVVSAYHQARTSSKEELLDYAMTKAPKDSKGRMIAAAAVRNSNNLALFNDAEEFAMAVDSVCTTHLPDREDVGRNLPKQDFQISTPDYGGFFSE